MVHGRVPIIRERYVVETNDILRRAVHVCIAHTINSHVSADSTAAASNLVAAAANSIGLVASSKLLAQLTGQLARAELIAETPQDNGHALRSPCAHQTWHQLGQKRGLNGLLVDAGRRAARLSRSPTAHRAARA
jgi:hypothetical protein